MRATSGNQDGGRSLHSDSEPRGLAGTEENGFRFCVGARRAEDLTKTVSAHVMSGLVGRGLANPTTDEMARKLREGLHETWNALGRQADADASSWRTFLEERGIMDEASRQGWAAVVSRRQHWLVFNPKDLSATRWGVANDVLQEDDHKQLTL